MSVSAIITDPKNSRQVGVTVGEEKDSFNIPAVPVATRRLKKSIFETKFFFNPTYGIDMNQDASVGGTPEQVHNGIDTTLWTASSIAGVRFTFDKDDTHAYAGAITIVSANDCAGDTQTIGVNGVDTTKTEGVDWNLVAGDNSATATALAAELDTISGVSASATGAVVTVTADSGNDITTIDTSDGTNCPGTAQSVETINALVGDTMQFAKGSDLTVSNYVALSMRIFVDANWASGDSIKIYGWDTDTSTQVGDEVVLENYFTFDEFDTWQKITIPLTDMGALASSTTLDALRIEIVTKTALGPTYYIDNLQFEETGTPIIYEVRPNTGTEFELKEFVITFADAYAGTLADATMPNIAYDKILGLNQLITGIVWQVQEAGETAFVLSFRTLMDFIQAGAELTSLGSDGTNTWLQLVVKFGEGTAFLKDIDQDFARVIIADDLSGLLHFRIAVRGGTEKIST